jgi:hypothetical protein
MTIEEETGVDIQASKKSSFTEENQQFSRVNKQNYNATAN